MKKFLFTAIVSSFLFAQCGEDKDPFLIENGTIGNLTSEMMMKQVDSIFAQDSIVKLNPIKDALGTQGEVEIYEKGGAKLLLLSPRVETDPESEIMNIQVFDERYKTGNGLSVASTFKDVKDNYTISNIETTFNAIVVFLEGSDVYITIDKKELPEDLRYNNSLEIEASQIPDTAKFKYFMIGWDPEIEEDEA